MSTIGVNNTQGSDDIKLNKSVDKFATAKLVKRVQTDGKITKSDFKKLATQIKGGQKELGKILKSIDPSIDVSKLQKFTFKRDGKSVAFNVNQNVKTKLSSLMTQIEGKEQKMDIMFKGLKGGAEKLSKKGDSISQSVSFKVFANASFSAVDTLTGDSEAPTGDILGGLDAELFAIGIEGEVSHEVESSMEVVDDGKVELTLDVKTTAGGSVSIEGPKFGGHGLGEAGAGGSIAAKKSITYTFNSKEDAIDFLSNKGKGFSPVDGESDLGVKKFTKTDTGFHKVLGASVEGTGAAVPTKITRKISGPKWFQSIRKKLAFSVQTVSSSVENSKLEGTTKTFTLDTKKKFLWFEKKTTTTEMSITAKKDETSGKNEFEGLFTMDINIEKFRNNDQRDALVDKLVGRYKKVYSATTSKAGFSKANVTIDDQAIRKFIEGSIDKVLIKMPEYDQKKSNITGVTESGKLRGVKNKVVDGFAATVAIPGETVGGSVSLSVQAAKTVRIYVPLEAIEPGDLSIQDGGIDKKSITLADTSSLSVGDKVEIDGQTLEIKEIDNNKLTFKTMLTEIPDSNTSIKSLEPPILKPVGDDSYIQILDEKGMAIGGSVTGLADVFEVGAEVSVKRSKARAFTTAGKGSNSSKLQAFSAVLLTMESSKTTLQSKVTDLSNNLLTGDKKDSLKLAKELKSALTDLGTDYSRRQLLTNLFDTPNMTISDAADLVVLQGNITEKANSVNSSIEQVDNLIHSLEVSQSLDKSIPVETKLETKKDDLSNKLDDSLSKLNATPPPTGKDAEKLLKEFKSLSKDLNSLKLELGLQNRKLSSMGLDPKLSGSVKTEASNLLDKINSKIEFLEDNDFEDKITNSINKLITV